MRQRFRALLFIFIVFYCITTLSSCANPRNYSELTASADQIITIKTTSDDFHLWETNDVTVRYKMVTDENNLNVSGTIQIADSVLYTFPNVRFFNLYLYFLDENGKATGRYNISPLYSTNFDRTPFSRSLPKSEESVSIAFGYRGMFEEHSSRFRRDSDDWYISHNPFRRK